MLIAKYYTIGIKDFQLNFYLVNYEYTKLCINLISLDIIDLHNLWVRIAKIIV